jgi:hypothetical protein
MADAFKAATGKRDSPAKYGKIRQALFLLHSEIFSLTTERT